MAEKIRSRIDNDPQVIRYSRTVGGVWTDFSTSLVGMHICDDSTHRRNAAGNYSDGGYFRVVHNVDRTNTSTLSGSLFKGEVYPGWLSAAGLTAYTPSLATSLQAIGTTSIAQAMPTNPTFSAATFLGELRSDGLPKMLGHDLWKERSQSLLKRGSGDYLNYEFGWKPMVSDIRDFAKAVKRGNQIIKSYHKGSDRSTSVRRSGKELGQTATASGTVFLQPQFSGVPSTAFPTVRTQEIAQKQWFVGRFRYHIPMGNDLLSKMTRWEADANKLLGTRITPATLWEIAPWSWAVDWFTNTGDVIHNISAMGADGLVLESGYQMEETKDISSALTTIPTPNPGVGLRAGALTRTRTYIVRQRIPANPYGFGLTYDGLSGRQQAILSALGISRGKH